MQTAEVKPYSKELSKELEAKALDELRRHGYESVSAVDRRRKVYRAKKEEQWRLIQIKARNISGLEAEMTVVEDDKITELRRDLRPDEAPIYAYIVSTKRDDVLFCAFHLDDVSAMGEPAKHGTTLKHKELQARAEALHAAGREVIFTQSAANGSGERIAMAEPAPVYRTPPQQLEKLDTPGQALLAVLIKALDEIVPGEPETYIGYGRCHDELLGLEKTRATHGESLSDQGLASLADWLWQMELPAITGIIVSQSTMQPGSGYYKVYGKSQDRDFKWWREEVEKAKVFDWQPYVRCIIAGQLPCDYEVPQRADIVVSRFIRNNALSRRVKERNAYQCQVCDGTLELANGEKYAEAHHIRPLGAPHNGADSVGNMLCVCPNCHVRLDYGALKLDKKTLKRAASIEEECIDYHNEKIYKR